MFLLASAQRQEKNIVYLSQQEVILKHVLTHCFEHPQTVAGNELFSSHNVPSLRTGYCYVLPIPFINVCFCFDSATVLCYCDFSITLGHFSVSYSGSGRAFHCQDKRGGHCNNVWTRSESTYPRLCLQTVYSLDPSTHCMILATAPHCMHYWGRKWEGPLSLQCNWQAYTPESQIQWRSGIVQRPQKSSACYFMREEVVSIC